MVLCLATVPGATADPDDDPVPSRERVQRAQEQVATTSERVDAIEARLVAADQRLANLSMKAAKAAEAYNGARYELREARVVARRAERAAEAAASRVRRAEDHVAAAIVANFENGGSLAGLDVLLNEPDPSTFLEQLEAYHVVTGAAQDDLTQYESAKLRADRLQGRAESALDEQAKATEKVEAAKAEVDAAVADAQAAVSRIAAKKETLVRKLAEARGTSVELARQRQQALAEQAEQEAAEAAREQAQQEQQEEQEEQEQDEPTDEPEPDTNEPAPSDDDVETAIGFAKDQLGEPYVYGADGPDSWDCSGLTMQAWAAAGESLSHWSVAQYYETTPISFSDIRRGDLLFWGSSDDPDTIYHVAIYLGNGRMIHAPQPDRSVEIVSLYYWILPNLYTRV